MSPESVLMETQVYTDRFRRHLDELRKINAQLAAIDKSAPLYKEIESALREGALLVKKSQKLVDSGISMTEILDLNIIGIEHHIKTAQEGLHRHRVQESEKIALAQLGDKTPPVLDPQVAAQVAALGEEMRARYFALYETPEAHTDWPGTRAKLQAVMHEWVAKEHELLAPYLRLKFAYERLLYAAGRDVPGTNW